jgi:hypothetical protein
VGVAVQAPLGVTIRGLVAGQVPDDERLVARAGQEHVGAASVSVCRARRYTVQHGGHGHALLERGREGCNPAGVALKGATENQLLGHICGRRLLRCVGGGRVVWQKFEAAVGDEVLEIVLWKNSLICVGAS